MNRESMIIDDDFIPIKSSNIDIHEIQSKYASRYFVLVDQTTNNTSKLDIKDYFLWENIDNGKSLGQLKQDYYQKFKTIPSQRIMDLMELWVDTGFLSSNKDIRESFPYIKALGVVETSFSINVIRNIFGKLSSLFHSIYLCALFIAVIPIAMGISVYMKGSGIFFLCLEIEGASPMLIVQFGAIGAYAIVLLRLFIRLGVLAKVPIYKGDRGFIGLFFLIPYLRINTKGLLLKPLELRMINHIYIWLLPLLISSFCYCLLSFNLDLGENLSFIISSLALTMLLDFIISSCPFYRSFLVRILDEISETIPTYKLMQSYLQDSYQFNSENSIKHRKLLNVFLSLIFIWIVLGSSFLLISTARYTDSLTEELKRVLELNTSTIELIQWLLYAPILGSFIFLFYKLIQPFIQRISQNPIWKNQYIFAAMLNFLGIGLGVLSFFIPPLLGYTILIIFILGSLNKNFKTFTQLPSYLKLHVVAQCISTVSLLASIFLPELTPSILAVGIVWIVWHIYTSICFSPRSSSWNIKLHGTSVLLALIYATVPFLFEFSLPIIIFAVCIGIATSNLIWFFSGQITVHFLHSCVIQMCLLIIYQTYDKSPAISSACTCIALILIYFQYSAMQWSSRSFITTAPKDLFSLKESPRESIEGTLTNFIRFLLGGACVKNVSDKKLTDSNVLRYYEVWLSNWMSKRSLLQALKFSLSSVPWEDRNTWSQRLGNSKVSSLENKSKLDDAKRLLILRSQLAFKGFKAEELKGLIQQFEVNAYQKGQYIAKQSKNSQPWLEIIVNGHALMQKEAPNGMRSSLAELGNLDAIQSEDLIKDGNYDFSVRCVRDTLTVRLYRMHFEKWGKENPKLLHKVLESMQLAKMVMGLSLFRDFSKSQMRILLEQLQKGKFKSKENIIRQGESGDKFYLLDKGNVDILIGDHKVASLGPGSYFGEIALLEKCKRTATVQASETCTTYSLGKNDFNRFFAGGRSAQVLQNISSSRVSGV